MKSKKKKRVMERDGVTKIARQKSFFVFVLEWLVCSTYPESKHDYFYSDL